MITIDMIDQFRKRTHCNYAMAKKYLEQNNGDFVEAIVHYERDHSKNEFDGKHNKLKNFFVMAYRTRVMLDNNGMSVLNVSILFFILFILFTLRVFLVIALSFITAQLLGYRFSIIKYNGSEIDLLRSLRYGNEIGSNESPYQKQKRESSNNDATDSNGFTGSYH